MKIAGENVNSNNGSSNEKPKKDTDAMSTGPVLYNRFEKKSYFPNFDGTKDSGIYGDYDSDSNDGDKDEPIIDCSGGGYPW
jgi:hypothetical protein